MLVLDGNAVLAGLKKGFEKREREAKRKRLARANAKAEKVRAAKLAAIVEKNHADRLAVEAAREAERVKKLAVPLSNGHVIVPIRLGR